MKIAVWVVLLGLVGWGAYSFATSNSQAVQVDLFLRTFGDLPLWAALVGAAVAGAVLTLFALSPSLLRLRLRARRQGRKLTELEQEIHGLRTLPLSDEIETAEGARES